MSRNRNRKSNKVLQSKFNTCVMMKNNPSHFKELVELRIDLNKKIKSGELTKKEALAIMKNHI